MFKLIQSSIKIKIALFASIIFIILGVASMLNSYLSVKEFAINNAKKIAIDESNIFASKFKVKIDEAMALSRNLSKTFATVKDKVSPLSINRNAGNTMVRDLLEDNPDILGLTAAWIPDNSFDGRDSEFKNIAGECPTGRFNSYYTWSNGVVTKQPQTMWEDEVKSEYFTKPRDLGKECIIDPYYYPVDGKDVLMVTMSNPIINNNKFYGITCVDFSIKFIQEIADLADIFNKTGKITIISGNGTIIGMTGNANLAGKKIDSIPDNFNIKKLKDKIKMQETITDLNENDIYSLRPVQLGRADENWMVYLEIPISETMKEANSLIIKQILLLVVMSILGIILMIFIASRISKPITKLAEAVTQIKKGIIENIDINSLLSDKK